MTLWENIIVYGVGIVTVLWILAGLVLWRAFGDHPPLPPDDEHPTFQYPWLPALVIGIVWILLMGGCSQKYQPGPQWVHAECPDGRVVVMHQEAYQQSNCWILDRRDRGG